MDYSISTTATTCTKGSEYVGASSSTSSAPVAAATTSTLKLGYKILKVQQHSPAFEAGLISFQDYIVDAKNEVLLGSISGNGTSNGNGNGNGNTIYTSNGTSNGNGSTNDSTSTTVDNDFLPKLLHDNINRTITLSVWNIEKQNHRNVDVIPRTDWSSPNCEEHGNTNTEGFVLLGISMKLEYFISDHLSQEQDQEQKNENMLVGEECSNGNQKNPKFMDGVDEITNSMITLWSSNRPPLPQAVSSTDNVQPDWYAGPSSSTNIIGDDPKLKTAVSFMSTLNKAWAKEMYNIDPKERENVTNEIHGIQSDRDKMMKEIESSSEMIDVKVRSFRVFLKTHISEPLDNQNSIVPPVSKDPYRRGLHVLDSRYIISNMFLLKFLRAAYYDFTNAALRYFRYLDLLYFFFDDVGLSRQISLTDLTKRELQYLKKGQMQLLSSRDKSGRRIYAFSGYDMPNYNIREKYRVNIYLVDVMSDDITTQKLGCVSVNAPRTRFDPSNPFGHDGMTLKYGKNDLLGCTEVQCFRKINEAIPLRVSGLHYFFPSSIMDEIMKSFILVLLGKDHRKIVRFHTGSHLEMMYSLRSFGIPHDDMTITEGQNIKSRYVPKFIKARESIESCRQEQGILQVDPNNSTARCPGYECPEVNHVVFGDRTFINAPANIEFRELVMVTLEDERVKGNFNVNQCIENIITKARSTTYNFRFSVFDNKSHLFVDIHDHDDLRKRVLQSVAHQRKRLRIEGKEFAVAIPTTKEGVGKQRRRSGTKIKSKQQIFSNTFYDVGIETSSPSIMGLGAAKRFKRSKQNKRNINFGITETSTTDYSSDLSDIGCDISCF